MFRITLPVPPFTVVSNCTRERIPGPDGAYGRAPARGKSPGQSVLTQPLGPRRAGAGRPAPSREGTNSDVSGSIAYTQRDSCVTIEHTRIGKASMQKAPSLQSEI